MKRILFLILLVALSCDKEDRIVVGSKNFSEQVILAEMLVQHIERTLNIPVERKLNLGGSFICHKALVSGEIDLYVEYTGTAYTAILKREVKSDPTAVLNETRDAYKSQFDLLWTEPFGFNNTFAIIIRGEDARRLGLKTISDAARHTPNWKAGFGYEFTERKDGYPGLAEAYNLKFSEHPKVMDLMLTYRAVAEKQVDVISGNSTDGTIAKLDLFVLDDDKRYFPPYEAAPVVRNATLKKFPKLLVTLNQLAGKISEDDMRKMNYEVDGEHKDARQVALEFLQRLEKGK